MTKKLEGQDVSVWVATTPKTKFPKLDSDTGLYDIAVVGYITGRPLKWAKPFSLERLKEPIRDEDRNNNL